jgi:hypothetical protein
MGQCELDYFVSVCGPVDSFCEHGNETPGPVKCWEIL